MVKIRHQKYYSLAILGLSFLIFGLYFAFNHQKFEPLLNVSVIFLIPLVLANLVSIFLNGLFIKLILKPFNKQIPITESIYISAISSVGNFFAPVGTGLGLRAVYLKKKHNLSYSNFLSTLSGNYVIVFFVTSVVGILSLLFLSGHRNSGYWVLLAVFTGLFLVDLILMSVKFAELLISLVNKFNKDLFVPRILSKVLQGWRMIISHGSLMLNLFLLTIVGFLASTIITILILEALHFDLSIWAVMLFVALASIAVFVNITPGNIGIKESILLFSSSVLGLSTDQILSYALIDRGVLFFTLVIVWAISSRHKYAEKMLAR